MGLQLLDLDDPARALALEELDQDRSAGNIYLGEYLSEAGGREYPSLLRRAIESGNDDSLAADLSRIPGGFKSHYRRRTRSGGFTMAKVPYTAAQTLAEGEFNRYYVRGLCRLVVAEDPESEVEVYRARLSSRPRFESVALVGQRLNASMLLDDLRRHIGEPPSLLPQINSGLSVRRLPTSVID